MTAARGSILTIIRRPAFWREWMGVEPTAARSARPATGFEDQGTHRDTTTPISKCRTLYAGKAASIDKSIPFNRTCEELDISLPFR